MKYNYRYLFGDMFIFVATVIKEKYNQFKSKIRDYIYPPKTYKKPQASFEPTEIPIHFVVELEKTTQQKMTHEDLIMKFCAKNNNKISLNN